MRPKARTLACLTAAAALNSAFATNGYFTHGIGPQSKAMAGTGVASPGFILAPGVMEQHFTTGFTARRGEREYSLAFMFAPKKTITGNNLFEPTQTLDLSMRQFELEFSMRF